jgi:hypothetical protein
VTTGPARAIRVSHPGKNCTIGAPKERYGTFRDAIIRSLKN